MPQGHLLNYAHSSIIHDSQNQETTYMALSQRLDKENVVHLPKGLLLSGNNDILKFSSKWMELEKKILSEVTQTQKNKTV